MRYKKILIFLSILFAVYAIATYFYFSAEPISLEYCPITIPGKPAISLEDPHYPDHQFKTINDASCLNETRVFDIIQVKSVDAIYQALKLAREKNLHIAIAGRRHSMGGQSFYKDALVLDMTHFNRIICLDEKINYSPLKAVPPGMTFNSIYIPKI